MIERALLMTGGNRAEAARRLNINRQLLYDKVRRYGIGVSGNRTEDVTIADGGDDARSEKNLGPARIQSLARPLPYIFRGSFRSDWKEDKGQGCFLV